MTVKTISKNTRYINVPKKLASDNDYILIFRDDNQYQVSRVYACANGEQRAKINGLKTGDSVTIKKIDFKKIGVNYANN